MGLKCVCDDGLFRVEPSPLVAARRITTGLWPGFPSDLVSLVTVLATQAEGRTLVHDWMYELRLFALEQLSGMSADLFLCDPHRIIVTGPTKLRGPAARQPRSAFGNGADCRGAGRGRGEPAGAARDRRARLRGARRAAAGARREGRAQSTADRRSAASRAATTGFLGGATGTVRSRQWRLERLRERPARAAVAAVARIADHRCGRDRPWDPDPPAVRRPSARIAADAERPQVGFGEIEHADDVRRQREDDVGLLSSPCGCARTGGRRAGGRSGPGMPSSDCALVVADQARQHVRLAVLAGGSWC